MPCILPRRQSAIVSAERKILLGTYKYDALSLPSCPSRARSLKGIILIASQQLHLLDNARYNYMQVPNTPFFCDSLLKEKTRPWSGYVRGLLRWESVAIYGGLVITDWSGPSAPRTAALLNISNRNILSLLLGASPTQSLDASCLSDIRIIVLPLRGSNIASCSHFHVDLDLK